MHTCSYLSAGSERTSLKSHQSTEFADPRQYLRLLLIRLLETQKCLTPLIEGTRFPSLKAQYLTNEYTLSEIKSWLEAQGDTSPLGPALSSAPTAENSGPGSSTPASVSPVQTGAPPWPYVRPAQGTRESQKLPSSSQSMPAGHSAHSAIGRRTFLPQSYLEKQSSISNGGVNIDKPSDSTDNS